MINPFSEFAGEASPSFAAEQMASKQTEYCVVFDGEGRPAILANLEDIREAARSGSASLLDASRSLPPTIFVPETWDVTQTASDQTVSLLEFGARGAVLVSGRTVKGIIPASLIIEALGSGGALGGGRQMGIETSLADIQLGGATNIPVGRVVCRQCGYANEILFLDPDYLPRCKNPDPPHHQLRLS
jgi:hypothetical protein